MTELMQRRRALMGVQGAEWSLVFDKNKIINWNLNRNAPNYGYESSLRASYHGLDFMTESGYTYTVTLEEADGKTPMIVIYKLSPTAVAQFEANETLSAWGDSGYKNSGYSFTADDGEAVWFMCKNSDNSNIAVDSLTVTFTREVSAV